MQRAVRVSKPVFYVMLVVKELTVPLLLLPAVYVILFLAGEIYIKASMGLAWCAMPKPHIIKPVCDGQACEHNPQDIVIAIQNISFIDRETYRQQECSKQNPFRVVDR
jgi:hypothetical protein